MPDVIQTPLEEQLFRALAMIFLDKEIGARAREITTEDFNVWEYGVEYDVSSTVTIHTAAHSQRQAEKWVKESPTDTGLRRRVPAGPWEVV